MDAQTRRAIERWFASRGVPQLIEGFSSEQRMDARAGPYIAIWIVVGTYLLALVIFGSVLFYTGAALTEQVAQLARNYPQTEANILGVLAEWQRGLQFGRLEISLTDLYAANPRALMFGTDLPSTRAPRPYQDDDYTLVLETLGEENAANVFYKNAIEFYRPKKVG